MAKLVIYQSDGRTREVLLDRDRVTIGRRPDHDVCLPFPAVSADHGEIITVGADSFLHDLGSTNGTVVNGNRVTKHFLRDRDEIELGRQHLVYVVNEHEKVASRTIDDDESSSKRRSDESHKERYTEPIGLATEQRLEIPKLSPVDELLSDLMEMNTEASAAVDIPPPVSIVSSAQTPAAHERTADEYQEGTAGAYIEVMSGPNAGQITPMTKSEFVFGKAGATLAVIRKEVAGYVLVPTEGARAPMVNGEGVGPEGAQLQFGDTIVVGGVTLRFNRRVAL